MSDWFLRLFRYGNYLGHGHSNMGEVPVDEIDYVSFMHDVDHEVCGGDNYYADLAMHNRLKLVVFRDLKFVGKLYYIGTKFIYPAGYLLYRRLFKKPTDAEKIKWDLSVEARESVYMSRGFGWNQFNLEKFLLS